MDSFNTIYYGNVVKRLTGKIYDGKFNTLKLMYKNIGHQGIFYPKSSYKFKYDTNYTLLADYVHNLKLWSLGFEFKYFPFNIGTNTISFLKTF